MDSLTATLAAEWAPRVRVNSLRVGMVRTELVGMHYGDEDGIAAVAATVSAMSMAVSSLHGFAVLLSLFVALAAAIAGYTRYRDQSSVYQQTADALEREYESVELRVGRYRRFATEREAYAEFAESVETLRSEHPGRMGSPISDPARVVVE